MNKLYARLDNDGNVIDSVVYRDKANAVKLGGTVVAVPDLPESVRLPLWNANKKRWNIADRAQHVYDMLTHPTTGKVHLYDRTARQNREAAGYSTLDWPEKTLCGINVTSWPRRSGKAVTCRSCQGSTR